MLVVETGFLEGVAFDDDQLRLGHSDNWQMLQVCDAVFVRPVLEYVAYKED